jgi:hypothetical protein
LKDRFPCHHFCGRLGETPTNNRFLEVSDKPKTSFRLTSSKTTTITSKPERKKEAASINKDLFLFSKQNDPNQQEEQERDVVPKKAPRHARGRLQK